LNTDGTVDTGFTIGTGPGGSSTGANSLDIQSDGKILVGGFFTSFNGTSSNRIVRLNTDGSIDTAFSTSIGDGMVDIRKFYELGENRSVDWFIIEEEMTSNPLKIVERAYNYLSGLING